MAVQGSIRPTNMGQGVNLFAADQRSAQANGPEANTQAERPQSKLWLNIGRYTDVYDPETNAVIGQELVSFPVNLPIDTMRSREYPWRKGKVLTKAQQELKDLIDASNQMLEFMKAFGFNKVEPGTSVDITGTFAVVLQRVADDVEDAPAAEAPEHSKSAQISAMLASFGINK